MKPEAILVPLAAALVAGLAARALGRAGARRAGLWLCAALWAATLALWLAAEAATGWDALAWFVFAAFLAAPAAAGASLGLWLGLRRKPG